MEAIRINKFLSERGICSRREADRFIESGRVLVNGKACEPGHKVDDRDNITVNGKSISSSDVTAPELIAFYKPRGIVCTSSDKDRAQNIIDYIGYKTRLFPIGRLDKDSEGLILLTNRGELVNLINKARYGHEKEYIVRCERRLTDGFLKKLAQGVEIRIPVEERRQAAADSGSGHRRHYASGNAEKEYRLVMTKPCRVVQIDDHTFDIVLTQGLNRQIRRMCSALGNKVQRLKRIRVMNIKLGDLREGRYRQINGRELKELEKLLGLTH